MFILVRALAFVMGGPFAKGMLAVSPFYNPTDWLAGPDLPKKAKKAKKEIKAIFLQQKMR